MRINVAPVLSNRVNKYGYLSSLSKNLLILTQRASLCCLIFQTDEGCCNRSVWCRTLRLKLFPQLKRSGSVP